MAEKTNDASAIYLVGHGSFQEPRLIELQYRRIIRYMEALEDNSAGSLDIFVDLNIHGRRSPEANGLPNLSALRERMNDYDRIFIDIQDSRFDDMSRLVREALAGGPTILNVFYDEEKVLDRKLKAIYGKNARVDDITDGSDFTCFFPSLASNILEAALRTEILVDNPPSISNRISSLRDLQPYRGGKTPFIEDRLRFEWKNRIK